MELVCKAANQATRIVLICSKGSLAKILAIVIVFQATSVLSEPKVSLRQLLSFRRVEPQDNRLSQWDVLASIVRSELASTAFVAGASAYTNRSFEKNAGADQASWSRRLAPVSEGELVSLNFVVLNCNVSMGTISVSNKPLLQVEVNIQDGIPCLVEVDSAHKHAVFRKWQSGIQSVVIRESSMLIKKLKSSLLTKREREDLLLSLNDSLNYPWGRGTPERHALIKRAIAILSQSKKDILVAAETTTIEPAIKLAVIAKYGSALRECPALDLNESSQVMIVPATDNDERRMSEFFSSLKVLMEAAKRAGWTAPRMTAVKPVEDSVKQSKAIVQLWNMTLEAFGGGRARGSASAAETDTDVPISFTYCGGVNNYSWIVEPTWQNDTEKPFLLSGYNIKGSTDVFAFAARCPSWWPSAELHVAASWLLEDGSRIPADIETKRLNVDFDWDAEVLFRVLINAHR